MPPKPRFSRKQALAMKRLLDKGVLRSEIARRYKCSFCAVISTLARLEGPPPRGSEEMQRRRAYRVFAKFFPEIPRERYLHFYRLSQAVPGDRYKSA